MTRKTSKTLRKAGAVALSLALAVSTLAISPDSDAAAKKPALAKKSVSVKVKKTKTVKVKNVTKKNAKSMTVKSANKKIAKAGKIFTKKKAAVKATGVKKGATKFTVVVKLKKKVAKKKKYTLKLAVKVTKATPTPTAEPTAEPKPCEDIALDVATASVVEGSTITLNATVTPNDTTDAVTWSSSDESIATVAAGVVTGVAPGTATITAKCGEKTADCVVTVIPAEVVAHIVGATQTGADALDVEFDTDAQALVNKDDIRVDAVDGTLSIPVNKISWSEDGKTASLVLATNLSDGKDYEVTYKDTFANFTASVGAVASIIIDTDSAEQNVTTEIQYKLKDAQGIDVTSAVDKTNMKFAFDGELAGYDDNPVKPTITMTTEGAVANVTATYDANKEGVEPITVTKQITCIEAKPTVGEKVFYDGVGLGGHQTSVEGEAGQVVDFYNGTHSDEVRLAAGETHKGVYFYAKAEDGSAIYYDNYEASSSNDDVATVTTEVSEGKFARFEVTGLKKGSSNVVIKATKNGKDTPYTIPITVTDKGVLDKATITGDTALSNTYDTLYGGTISVSAVDSNGNKLTEGALADYTVTCTAVEDADHKIGTASLDDNARARLGDNATGFVVNNSTKTFTAYGAKAGRYQVKVEVQATGSDKVISKTITVSVAAVSREAWDESKGANVTYSLDLSAKTIDVGGAPTSATARLKATVGSTFLGYVTPQGSDAAYVGAIGGNKGQVDGGTGMTTCGAVFASATSRITEMKRGVKYGTKYCAVENSASNAVGQSYDMFQSLKNVANTGVATCSGATATINFKDSSSNVIVQGDSTMDKTFAKAGTYTVEYSYLIGGKKDSKAGQIAVTNSIAFPKVTINSRTVETLDATGVKAVLSSNLDLNDKNYDNFSIKEANGIAEKFTMQADGSCVMTASAPNDSTKSVNVKYISVVENGRTYWCALGVTFKTA